MCIHHLHVLPRSAIPKGLGATCITMLFSSSFTNIITPKPNYLRNSLRRNNALGQVISRFLVDEDLHTKAWHWITHDFLSSIMIASDRSKSRRSIPVAGPASKSEFVPSPSPTSVIHDLLKCCIWCGTRGHALSLPPPPSFLVSIVAPTSPFSPHSSHLLGGLIFWSGFSWCHLLIFKPSTQRPFYSSPLPKCLMLGHTNVVSNSHSLASISAPITLSSPFYKVVIPRSRAFVYTLRSPSTSVIWALPEPTL